MGALNGALVDGVRAALDRGHAGHDGEPARGPALGHAGRGRPRPAGRLPVAGPGPGRRDAAWWSGWPSRPAPPSPGASAPWPAARAVYATGSDPETARLLGVRHAPGDVRGLRAHGRADRAGRRPGRGPVPAGPDERGHRLRAAGHRGRGGGRHRGVRRPRHAPGHPAGRDAARHDRPRPHVPRTSAPTGRRRSRGRSSCWPWPRKAWACAGGTRPCLGGQRPRTSWALFAGLLAWSRSRCSAPSATTSSRVQNAHGDRPPQRRARAAGPGPHADHRHRRDRPLGGLADGPGGRACSACLAKDAGLPEAPAAALAVLAGAAGGRR